MNYHLTLVYLFCGLVIYQNLDLFRLVRLGPFSVIDIALTYWVSFQCSLLLSRSKKGRINNRNFISTIDFFIALVVIGEAIHVMAGVTTPITPAIHVMVEAITPIAPYLDYFPKAIISQLMETFRSFNTSNLSFSSSIST